MLVEVEDGGRVVVVPEKTEPPGDFLMIGVEDHQVPQVTAIVRRTCRRCKQMAVTYSPAI